MDSIKSSRNKKTNIYADDKLISKALRCLEGRLKYKAKEVFNSSRNVCDYLRLQLAQEKSEVFAALFLDNRHCLLAFEKMFHGTINETTIYPRVIIQKSLEHNAAAVIVAHNHPSGNLEPSQADREITRQLKDVMDIMTIKLLDHVIISHQETLSFAERGLL